MSFSPPPPRKKDLGRLFYLELTVSFRNPNKHNTRQSWPTKQFGTPALAATERAVELGMSPNAAGAQSVELGADFPGGGIVAFAPIELV